MKFLILKKEVNSFKVNHLSGKYKKKDDHDSFSPFQLPDTSFTLFEGAFLRIIGKNGVGKSTLGKIIVKMIPKMKGRIEINSSVSFLSNILYLYISPDLVTNFQLTLKKEFLISSTLLTNLRNLSCQLLNLCIHFFEMNSFQNYLLKHLSLGQKNRFHLLLLKLSNKPIWILDEPTLGLDKKWTRLFYQLIYLHRKKGGIVLLITHQEVLNKDLFEINLNRIKINKNKRTI